MIGWKTRSPEVQNLFNPAFCGELIYQVIREYHGQSGRPFPFVLTFLGLPILLHTNTRTTMLDSRKQMHVWLQENQAARIGFAARCKDLLPITKESIGFLLHSGKISIAPDEGFAPVVQTSRSRRRLTEAARSELDHFTKAGKKLAKWLHEAGQPSSIYTMWGVRP